MRKNLITPVLAIILIACFALGNCPIAFAASTNDPYGFTYDDAASGKTVYKYYSYSTKEKLYKPTRTFSSSGAMVYNTLNMVMIASSAGSGSRYNGFSSDGTFYMITKTGGMISIAPNNAVATIYTAGAIRLLYNPEDLVYAVETVNGNKDLPSGNSSQPDTKPSTPSDPSTPATPTTKNKVEMYTNSAGEFVYNACEAGSIRLTIAVSANEQSVLNVTNGVRLTDTLKGAKFLGFDTSFNVYLYETFEKGGALYCFNYGSWYAAKKISLDGAFKKLETDENGFISAIITEKSRNPIGQITEADKWTATHTYVVSKETYSTMYTKGSSKSNTLLLEGGLLTLDGVKVTQNVKITKFGFISENTFCFILDGSMFTASLNKPTTRQHFCYNAVDFQTDNVGLVTGVVLKNGTVKKI